MHNCLLYFPLVTEKHPGDQSGEGSTTCFYDRTIIDHFASLHDYAGKDAG